MKVYTKCDTANPNIADTELGTIIVSYLHLRTDAKDFKCSIAMPTKKRAQIQWSRRTSVKTSAIACKLPPYKNTSPWDRNHSIDNAFRKIASIKQAVGMITRRENDGNSENFVSQHQTSYSYSGFGE